MQFHQPIGQGEAVTPTVGWFAATLEMVTLPLDYLQNCQQQNGQAH